MAQSIPQEQWLNTSQLKMNYLDWGDPSAPTDGEPGEAVLALHGLASSCHWYDLVIPHLTDAHRCVSLDQRGHGRTDQPGSGYDWKTLATDAVEALDQLGLQRVALLGHSWGGQTALGVAIHYPERVSRLVMIEGGFFDWSLWPETTWERFSSRLRPRNVSGNQEEFLGRLREQLSECWSDQLEGIVMSMVRVGSDGMVRDILEPTNHAQVLEAMWSEPSSTMFPRVLCPTMIVAAGPRAGAEDSEFAQRRRIMVEAAHSALKDCRVEWIPDTMHDVGYHKPMELVRTLRSFLGDA